MKPDPIHQHLQSLPDAPLPGAVLPRLLQRQKRRLVIRRLLAGTGMAAIALVIGLTLPGLRSPTPVAPHAIAAPAGAPHASLQAVDRALQTAYRFKAPDDELAALWNLRDQLLAHHFEPNATTNFGETP